MNQLAVSPSAGTSRSSVHGWRPSLALSVIRLEAIAARLEAIASRLEAIAARLEAIASRLEAIASRLEATFLAG